jgi:hypothetical protein
LATLKHAGIIAGEKRGRFVHYALCAGVLAEAIDAGVPKETLDLGWCQLTFCDG